VSTSFSMAADTSSVYSFTASVISAARSSILMLILAIAGHPLTSQAGFLPARLSPDDVIYRAIMAQPVLALVLKRINLKPLPRAQTGQSGVIKLVGRNGELVGVHQSLRDRWYLIADLVFLDGHGL